MVSLYSLCVSCHFVHRIVQQTFPWVREFKTKQTNKRLKVLFTTSANKKFKGGGVTLHINMCHSLLDIELEFSTIKRVEYTGRKLLKHFKIFQLINRKKYLTLKSYFPREIQKLLKKPNSRLWKRFAWYMHVIITIKICIAYFFINRFKK